MKILDKYFNLLSHYNVHKQLISIFICAVLLPTLVLGSVLSIYSCKQIISSYKDLTTSDTMRIRSILLNVTTDFYNIYQEIKQDEPLNDLLESSDTEAINMYNIYANIRSLLDAHPDVSTLKIYVPRGILEDGKDYPYFTSIDAKVKSTNWYQQIKLHASPFWTTKLRTDKYDNQFWELNFYARIPIIATGKYAIVNMTVSDNYLRSLIESNTLKTYISVNDDPVFYATLRQDAGTNYPVSLDHNAKYYEESGYMLIHNTPSIGSIATLKPYRCNDKIYILSSDMGAISHITLIGFSFLVILFLALFISFVIISFFTKSFDSRLQFLRLAMHKVSNNNYELVNSLQGDDELSAIFADLKAMVEKIKVTEAQFYEAQISKQQFENQQQQMEFKVLASQINPHFLYNTLETIRMKAFSEGNREVANAIKLLGKSMRYVLNNTGTTSTTLDKEVNYIQTYLTIQKLRFGDRLNYNIIIDENLNLNQYQILPLLLQPVVENAISHGIESTGLSGQLTISLVKEEDLLIVKIEDNGVGMNESELEKLNNQIVNHPKNSADSIGLYNINQRIKLYYGTAYGLSISSEKNQGTLVTITIPLHNLLEEDV